MPKKNIPANKSALTKSKRSAPALPVRKAATKKAPARKSQNAATVSDAALPTADYRHSAKTKNLPPAGLAAQGKIEEPRKGCSMPTTRHVDGSRFAALSGTVSLAFPAGVHKRIAVKVIDPRGNEVMKVARLDGKY